MCFSGASTQQPSRGVYPDLLPDSEWGLKEADVALPVNDNGLYVEFGDRIKGNEARVREMGWARSLQIIT